MRAKGVEGREKSTAVCPRVQGAMCGNAAENDKDLKAMAFLGLVAIQTRL
jgi:hypothetical protein